MHQLENAPQGLFSAGIHPWYLDNMDEQKERLMYLARRQECLAIGECGLDKLSRTWGDEQVQVFRWQIKLAEKFNKPVIIHCVKAFETLLKIKNELKPKMPWLIHGHRGKVQQTQQLVKQGFYLSIGVAILEERNTSLKESLKQIPMNGLFLESDESDRHISKVYHAVSEIMNIDLEDLKQQMLDNYQRFTHTKA